MDQHRAPMCVLPDSCFGVWICFLDANGNDACNVKQNVAEQGTSSLNADFADKYYWKDTILVPASWAVVHYMEELVAKRDVKAQPIKVKKTWAQLCFFSRPKKRKHDGLDYIKA